MKKPKINMRKPTEAEVTQAFERMVEAGEFERVKRDDGKIGYRVTAKGIAVGRSLSADSN